MKIKSYSKVNLFLKVFKNKHVGKIHDIYSFFQIYKKIYDLVEIKESNCNSIKYLSDNKGIKIKNCIVKKTLNYLKKNFEISKKYSIVISKNIPIGSGLGGASSNSATIIKYIFKNELIKNYNISNFIQLGSDIPFFLTNYDNALVTNYGANVEKLNKPKINYKIFISDIKCETKKIYNIFDCITSNKIKNFENQLIYLYTGKISRLENDLQEACFLEHPTLKKHYDFFSKKNNVLISGSGSTLIIYEKG